jgi:hypothetical protein
MYILLMTGNIPSTVLSKQWASLLFPADISQGDLVIHRSDYGPWQRRKPMPPVRTLIPPVSLWSLMHNMEAMSIICFVRLF